MASESDREEEKPLSTVCTGAAIVSVVIVLTSFHSDSPLDADQLWPVNSSCCSQACHSIPDAPANLIGPIRHPGPESAIQCWPYGVPGY